MEGRPRRHAMAAEPRVSHVSLAKEAHPSHLIGCRVARPPGRLRTKLVQQALRPPRIVKQGPAVRIAQSAWACRVGDRGFDQLLDQYVQDIRRIIRARNWGLRRREALLLTVYSLCFINLRPSPFNAHQKEKKAIGIHCGSIRCGRKSDRLMMNRSGSSSLGGRAGGRWGPSRGASCWSGTAGPGPSPGHPFLRRMHGHGQGQGQVSHNPTVTGTMSYE
jgi:hypothetical protein